MNRDYLAEIRSVVSIKDVIEERVKLSRKGREYIGLCPFHGEKTPSFFVNVDKGFYYCFGCQVRGNIFNFYMDFYKMSFKETLDALALKAGISLPHNIDFSSGKKTKDLYLICQKSKEYFCNNLHSKNGEKAMNYLLARGLSLKVIKEFELGYALKDNPILWHELASQGVNEEDILEVGLKGYSERGNLYEFFRERIIFPIKNKSGKVIAFGGRGISGEEPKYLNTKESEIFHKKTTLYGLYESLKAIRNNESFIVVEGYMDVISMHMHGFGSTIAALGTAVTKEHLVEIKKNGDSSPIFCMDGDLAGKKATSRIIDQYIEILTEGMNPRFAKLGGYNYKDPDDFLQNNKNEFAKIIEDAFSISEILFEEETKGKKLNVPEVSSLALKKLMGKIQNMPDNSLKNKFMQYFISRLYEYGGRLRKSYEGKFSDKNNKEINTTIDVSLEQYYIILASIISFPNILQEIEDKLMRCSFKDYSAEFLRGLLVLNIEKIENKEDVDKIITDNNLEDLASKIFSSMLVSPLKIVDQTTALQVFNGAYTLLSKESLMQEYSDTQRNLSDLVRDLSDIEEKINSVKDNESEDKKQLFLDKESKKQQIDVLFARFKEIKHQILQIK